MNTPRGMAAAMQDRAEREAGAGQAEDEPRDATVLNWSPSSEMLSPSQTKR